MFALHQPMISSFARQSPENLCSVLQLSILTAHAPFHRAPDDMASARQGGEEALAVLFGWKLAAWANLIQERDNIFHHCHDILGHAENEQDAENELLGFLASHHGLGFAKAGFAIQMAFGLSGCLDTHNLARFKIKPYITRARYGERAMTAQTWRTKIERYNATCRKLGGTAHLWDSWCEHVATKYPKIYPSAFAVSELHCIALGLIEPWKG